MLHSMVTGCCRKRNQRAVGELGLGTCEWMDAQSTQSASLAREIRDCRVDKRYRTEPCDLPSRALDCTTPADQGREGDTVGRGYLGCQNK